MTVITFVHSHIANGKLNSWDSFIFFCHFMHLYRKCANCTINICINCNNMMHAILKNVLYLSMKKQLLLVIFKCLVLYLMIVLVYYYLPLLLLLLLLPVIVVVLKQCSVHRRNSLSI